MKKSLLNLAVAAAIANMTTVRARTHDIAFAFRMGAGFPGDVNRTHPFSVIPGLMNATNPVRLYGDPVLVDTATNSFRGFIAADTTTPIIMDGVAVRPYPVQQTAGGMTSTIGTAAVQTNQPVDILEDGFVMAKVNGSATPTKKGGVWIYVAASTGAHVQGGFEAAAGTNLVLVTNAEWVGPPDASGVAEMRVWRQH